MLHYDGTRQSMVQTEGERVITHDCTRSFAFLITSTREGYTQYTGSMGLWVLTRVWAMIRCLEHEDVEGAMEVSKRSVHGALTPPSSLAPSTRSLSINLHYLLRSHPRIPTKNAQRYGRIAHLGFWIRQPYISPRMSSPKIPQNDRHNMRHAASS